jgi:hypothetical protein
MTKQSPKDAQNLFAKLAEQRQSSEPATIPTPTAAPDIAPKKGRAKGKRSDPNYVQIGVYVPKETKKACDRRLLDEEIDLSDLVSELLAKWLSE